MNMDRWNANRETAPDSYGEAEQWFVRLLEPDCPAEERAAFERWRNADPAHAAAYRELELVWRQSLDATKHPAVAAAARQSLRPEPQTRSPRRWLFPALATGFAALVAVVVVPRWLAHSSEPVSATYTTTAGQQQTVQLSDGSSIVLDTDTQVSVRYSASTRRVDLLHGQAQFSVHGNHAWPFVVHALHGTVTAVGTQFQVRVNDGCTDVALIQGKLAIATEPQNGTPHDASLVGGQGLAYDESGRISRVHAIDPQDVQAWTEGKLFVHDWRLSDLIDEMNRYSTTKLQIGDPSLRDIRISGVFHTNDQQTFLALLQQGWSIQAKRVDANQIVLTHNR
ncbi:FecR family protein [Dyella psychrodurans]|uniref:FecR family protein n=1 Tax=Dyella psychrodurans TaxID=1927960 RepID=A0A370WZ03_9GAMM|nr:FecR family protein [Dyella psychrodurans]RDS81388.1 FecR family protein [Dyella psychrodurans]